MKTVLPIVALAIFALSACAGPSAFSKADDNRDGRLSLEEARSSEELGAVFGSADGDKSGFLDPIEFELAEQLITGWKAAHGEGADHSVGAGGHSH